MRTLPVFQQQTVSNSEARSTRGSASLQAKDPAADDRQRFTEGFIAGWSSILGPRAVPTIIPHCAVPMGESPFQHGYDQARSFVESVQGPRTRSSAPHTTFPAHGLRRATGTG
jgi:hypothetical protein